MNIAFRVDSSVQIGSGHLMRCLTLADELILRGAKVCFVCRELPGNLCDLIQYKDYPVLHLPTPGCFANEGLTQYEKWLGVPWDVDVVQTKEALLRNGIDFDWIIVDSYAIGERWETEMRTSTRKIMVIDDLANRKHDCDLLLDQNFYQNLSLRYQGLVPQGCYSLLGPQYALLRPEFKDARNQLRIRDGCVKHIFVFFGGSDLTNETLKAIEAIRLLNRPDITLDVVVGRNHGNYMEIEVAISTMPQATLRCRVNNMAELMAAADLCIGAAGGTTWERCCVGLPSLVIAVAENQVKATCDMAEDRFLRYLGKSNQIGIEDICHEIQKLLISPALLKQYTMRGLKLVDGYGAARCVDKLLER